MIYFVDQLAKDIVMNLHSSNWAKLLTAKALDTLASVNLWKAVLAARHHCNSLGRTSLKALLTADTLVFLWHRLGVVHSLKYHAYLQQDREWCR